jgi:hypothetical protein
MEKSKIIDKLLKKLRSPLPIDYICENIIKEDMFKCIDLLKELEEKGLIEKVGNNIYKTK